MKMLMQLVAMVSGMLGMMCCKLAAATVQSSVTFRDMSTFNILL